MTAAGGAGIVRSETRLQSPARARTRTWRQRGRKTGVIPSPACHIGIEGHLFRHRGIRKRLTPFGAKLVASLEIPLRVSEEEEMGGARLTLFLIAKDETVKKRGEWRP